MLGQHIFVRCRNEQNNAGTWTAAMTENIVDKEIVRNLIEPRCNMDEAFAQRALMQNDNNVLRIYHAADNVTVVTRTYWVTDRITEAMGRKGAYSISYILTDDDKIRFTNDFIGAFDASCFETYDELVNRIQQNRITINDSFDLFSHGGGGFDPSVFEAVKFTKDSFVQFMNGLYAAIEGGKQFAVVLPEHVRRAWEENGDKTAEKLIYHVMNMLPDFTRMNLGVAAHWSCQIRDKMVADMHLVFVHPEKEEDLAYLKREGTMMLDLDSGKYTNVIPSIAPEYFAFLWDSLKNRDAIEEFWADTKSKYRKLLRGRPNSASAMECAYLMRCVSADKFKNNDLLRRTFLLAATTFAGAGSRVPAADEFLYNAIDALKLGKKTIDADIERALRHLMVEDPDQTKHQLQEYELLLGACERNEAADETVEALCDEVRKEERNATPYLVSYLSEKRALEIDKLSLQLVRFVSGLFVRLVVRHSEEQLFGIIFGLMQSWADQLLASDNIELLKPIASTYIGYLTSKDDNAQIRMEAYKIVFAFEHKGDAALREECAAVLFREEKRLYKAENETMDGPARIRMYAQAFFEAIPEITKMKKDTAIVCYQRLFRLAYKGDSGVVEEALKIYRAAISAAGEGDLIDRIIPVLLQCEEDALAQISGGEFWNPATVGKILLMFELINVSSLPRYAPTGKRVGELMRWYDKNHYNTYLVTAYYLNQMQLGDRHVIFKGLQDNGMLENLFLHVLFTENESELCIAIETYMAKNHAYKLSCMLTSALLTNTKYVAEQSRETFDKWYTNSLKKELTAVRDSVEPVMVAQAQNKRILEEYMQLRKLPEGPHGFKDIAKSALDKQAMQFFGGMRLASITNLSPNEIAEISRIIGDTTEEKPANEKIFTQLTEFDMTISYNSHKNLDDVCAENYNSENAPMLRERLHYYIQNEQRNDQLRRYWLYYLLLDMQPGAGGMQFRIDQYAQEIGCDAQGILLMNEAYALHAISSKFIKPFDMAVVNWIAPKVRENPQMFSNNEFVSKWMTLRKMSDQFRVPDVYSILGKLAGTMNLRFDTMMFIMCLIGTILVCTTTFFTAWLMIILGRVATFVMLSVGLFIFTIIVALDVCLMPKAKRSNKRAKNRRF